MICAILGVMFRLDRGTFFLGGGGDDGKIARVCGFFNSLCPAEWG